MTETIGGIIRRLRRAQNMTVVQLSAKVGVSPQQISKYEKGTNTPKMAMVERLAKALAVDPAVFFLGRTDGETTAITPHIAAALKISEVEWGREMLIAIAALPGWLVASVVRSALTFAETAKNNMCTKQGRPRKRVKA